MMPTVGGDLEHKSALELLSSPAFATRFDAATWDACTRHILWTRLLTERHTEGPAGVVVDLFPFARAAREALVLKPNRGYGGEGVLLGAHATEGEWDEALSRAAYAPGEWVVQSLCETNREPFVDASGVERELFTTCGFFPSAMGTGIFGRAGSSPVVNLSTGASLTPFLVSTRG